MRQTDSVIKLANLKLNYKTTACRLQAIAHLCWLKALAFKQFPAQHRFKAKFISFDFNLYLYHHLTTETTEDGRYIQHKCRISRNTSDLRNASSQRRESYVVARFVLSEQRQAKQRPAVLVLDTEVIRRLEEKSVERSDGEGTFWCGVVSRYGGWLVELAGAPSIIWLTYERDFEGRQPRGASARYSGRSMSWLLPQVGDVARHKIVRDEVKHMC